LSVAPVARFSEPLDPASVATSTVAVLSNGTPVAGTVTYDNAARSITFTPTSALAPNTAYQFQLVGEPNGIADLAGNHLAGTTTIAFTTGAAGNQTRYVSDLTWGTASNGWGPPERDRSNGETGATDGGPIRVAGLTYTKGVGVHAHSSIPIDLTGLNCARFQSVVGLDDEVAANGSVRFQVWDGTTTMLTQSDPLTGSSPAATLDIDITGITDLRLVVDDTGGNAYDHADWADAKLQCGPQSSAPTLVLDSPDPDARFAVGDTVSFSGRATASNGSPIPESQLDWDVQIRHCPGGETSSCRGRASALGEAMVTGIVTSIRSERRMTRPSVSLRTFTGSATSSGTLKVHRHES
jgi:hypothetical protein